MDYVLYAAGSNKQYKLLNLCVYIAIYLIEGEDGNYFSNFHLTHYFGILIEISAKIRYVYISGHGIVHVL